MKSEEEKQLVQEVINHILYCDVKYQEELKKDLKEFAEYGGDTENVKNIVDEIGQLDLRD